MHRKDDIELPMLPPEPEILERFGKKYSNWKFSDDIVQ